MDTRNISAPQPQRPSAIVPTTSSTRIASPLLVRRPSQAAQQSVARLSASERTGVSPLRNVGAAKPQRSSQGPNGLAAPVSTLYGSTAGMETMDPSKLAAG